MIKSKNLTMQKTVIITGLAMMVCACSGNYQNINLETPSLRMEEKMQASVTTVSQSWTLEKDGRYNQKSVAALAEDYQKRGQGKLEVMVTYAANECQVKEKQSRDKAAQTAQRLRKQFAQYGVKQVSARVAPTPVEKANLASVSYQALVLMPPTECQGKSLIGVDGHVGQMQDYSIGCDSQKLIAKMVSRKKDLLGQSKMDPASSSYLGSTMESYRAGETVGEDDLNVTTTQLSTAGQ
jgi:type IV pilus biogenesis protein CpaD/CtpE